MKSVILLTALWTSRIAAFNPNDQVGADIPYGTFQDPSMYVRPKFRYWIPDASINLSTVTEDFGKAKDVGMGGLELLGYYLYGDYPSVIAEGGPVPVDWTKYGWGTEAWKELMDVALKAAKDNGMIMDFANGPNQGAGRPAKPDDDGLMWDLIPFNVSIPIGGEYDNILPGWGTGYFVSASTGLVMSSQYANLSASPAWIGPYYYNGTMQTLATASLQDVTDQVFAYHQNQSTYREQASPLFVNTTVHQSPVETFVQNGSWIVDHYSSKGAQVIIDFWEDYLLDNGTRELIQEIDNYAWEDSQEFGAGVLVWWTPGLLDAFHSGRGYELNKYLPLIYSYNTEANGPLASPDHFYTDEVDMGQTHINDYWQTLTELNQVYLQTLSHWATSSLESQFSAQVVYNLPIDMLANVPSVNAPECESLGFDHIVDMYRQFSGPANLAGRRIVSSELGAQRNEVYSQTLPELIWDVKRSIVGSVNQFVYHGYPFTGSYPNTTWPGFTTFTYRFSNMHGPRQPAWEYYGDYMSWTARMQYVAQSGVPKIDLAFWLKRDTFQSVYSVYEPNDLVEAGFTYEYLSPDNFMLPEAYVADGVFAPSRQAFKAMIVRANDSLTVTGVQRLVEFAHDGLPIVFSGGMPQNLTRFNVSGTQYVRSALAGILDLSNVHIVPYDNLAASLDALDIHPRTKTSADQIWYTYWREDPNASVSYVVIYNDGWYSELGEGASTGSITFETSGVPYTYEAWTGDVSPIFAYQQTKTSITVSLSLAGNQTAIIAFRHNETVPTGTRILSMPTTVFSAFSEPDSGAVTLKATNDTMEPVLLSNGTTIPLPTPAAAIDLAHWDVIVESWIRPSDAYIDQTIAAKSNSTHHLTHLTPWNQVSESLRNVSGRGFYNTTFFWPPKDGTADGAMLRLGAIVHTARVWVNGHQLQPLDPTAGIADIAGCLVDGDNTIEVVVSTPLGNALKPIYQQSRTSGTVWLGPEPEEQDYGLVIPISVIPYRMTTVVL